MTGPFMASIAIKATVILALGLGARRMLRRSRAAVRHLLLLAVCVTVLALPAAALVLPVLAIPMPYRVPVSVPPAAPEAQVDIAFTPVAGAPVTQSATGTARSVSTIQLVLIAEGLGTTLALMPLLAGLWQTRRLRAAARQWPGGQQRIERLVGDAQIRRCVDVLVHDDLPGPVTCGVWRPVLLFPADATHWDDADFERAAIHELEHVRRNDWATDCLARVVCAVYWFHPLVWVTWRQLRLESERAADDAVVRAREGTAYAELLITLAERLVPGRRNVVTAMASRRDLPLRVQALLDASLPRERAGRRSVVITILLTASAILGVAPLGALTEVRTAAIEPDTRLNSMPTETMRPASEVISARRVSVPLAGQREAPPPAPVPLAAQQTPPPPSAAPRTTAERLVVLLFDVAGMEPDGLRRATAAGVQFVTDTMTDADVVALVTNGTRLRVVKDFTSSREELRTALESPGLMNETAPDVGALAMNPIGQTDDAAMPADVSLRALATLCGMLRPFEQRKTVIYFASGMSRATGDFATDLRAVTNACVRANVAIYPVDARGFRFVVRSVF